MNTNINDTVSNNLKQEIKSEKIMKYEMTPEECKAILESIFNDAIENGKDFEMETLYLTPISEYKAKGGVEVVITTSDKHLPEIYINDDYLVNAVLDGKTEGDCMIDEDYAVLDGKTVRFCKVPVDELMSWGRSTEWSFEEEEAGFEEDVLTIDEVNNLIGRLITYANNFSYMRIAKTLEDFKWLLGNCEELWICNYPTQVEDDAEVYVWARGNLSQIEVEVFTDVESLMAKVHNYTRFLSCGLCKCKWGEVKKLLRSYIEEATKN